MEVKQSMPFNTVVFSIFRNFGLRKRLPNQLFLVLFRIVFDTFFQCVFGWVLGPVFNGFLQVFWYPLGIIFETFSKNLDFLIFATPLLQNKGF